MSLEHNDSSAVRLQLHSLGYVPLPNRGKLPAIKGWNGSNYYCTEISPPKAKGDVARRLQSWLKRFPGAHTTGVRIEGGLLVIDIDVDDENMVEKLFAALQRIAPEVWSRAPVRYGGGQWKLALFAQMDGEDFIRLGTRKYHRPDEPESQYHHIEAFGGRPFKSGKCSRQFAVWGPRSYAADGTVESWYDWAQDTPALFQVALTELPMLSKFQVLELLDAFEAEAEAAGWIRIEGANEGDGETEDVFDINRETVRFDIFHGESQISYGDLESMVLVQPDVRVSPEFMPGETTERADRCSAYWSTKYDCVVIRDWKTAQRHYPIDLAPIDIADFGVRLRQAAAKIGVEIPPGRPNWRADYQTLGATAQPRPTHDAALEEKGQWLLNAYGYCALNYTVVDLFTPHDECQLGIRSFQTLYRAWREDISDPDNVTRKYVYATGIWEVSEDRIDVQGVRMRPDQAFPIYAENGVLFKNSYLQPRHEIEGGDIKPFLDFLNRFLPIEHEREWLLNWMAHKQMHPEIPGTAILFVADSDIDMVREGKFGTGRGLMFRIVHKLYGESYARAEDFDIISGGSNQSAYTDWRHNSVIVTIDEAQVSPTAHRRGERKSVYEVLKNVVDPAPKRCRFKAKYGKSFDGVTYASIWVATNHVNAVAIPKTDRRFTVLRNGRVMTAAESQEIADWLMVPANIAALAHLLSRRKLTGFNMYVPLETAGKAEMVELAISPVEEALIELMEDDERGVVFTRMHLEQELEHTLSGSRNRNMPGHYWRAQLEGLWNDYCVLLKTENGSPCRIRVEGKLKKIHCFRIRLYRAKTLTESQRRNHAAKWGLIDGLKELLTVVPKPDTGGLHPTED